MTAIQPRGVVRSHDCREANRVFPNLAPHDLRRTAAKLILAGGAPLEQISLILGHSSLDVTKRYLGVDLELQNAATDRIPLRLTARPPRVSET